MRLELLHKDGDPPLPPEETCTASCQMSYVVERPTHQGSVAVLRRIW